MKLVSLIAFTPYLRLRDTKRTTLPCYQKLKSDTLRKPRFSSHQRNRQNPYTDRCLARLIFKNSCKDSLHKLTQNYREAALPNRVLIATQIVH